MSAAAKNPAEKRNIIILAALLVIAAVVLYINVFSGDSPSSPTAVAPAPAQQVAAQAIAPDKALTRRNPNRTSVAEFKPRQGPFRPEDRVDPSTIDPTIRLDLLAKVQAVEPEQSLRNIFQYGAAPPPPAPKPVALPSNPPRIAMNTPPAQPPRPTAPVTPPAPTAPPMTFKYYGFKLSKSTGRRQAFLLDGDEIILATENESVKGGRYRIVRIGPTTITIEDTQFKASQTLTLQEDAAAAA